MSFVPDDSALQVFYGALPLIGAGVLALWNNSKRLDDIKFSLNKRIDDLAAMVWSNFVDVKTSILRLDGRVSNLEKSTRFVR